MLCNNLGGPLKVKNLRVKNVKIIGHLRSYPFECAKYFAEELHRSLPLMFPAPEITGLFEMEWSDTVAKWGQTYGGEFWYIKRPVAVFLDGKFIGSDIEFFKITCNGNIFVESIPMEASVMMQRRYESEFLNYLKSTKLTYCYFDIWVDEKFIGKLIFKLYSDVLPKTCENFATLCSGAKGDNLTYKGTHFTHIAKDGWLQGGDIEHGLGSGGHSIWGGTFPDECFGICHDRRGVLSMVNSGRHTNGSQFFITLAPLPWMNTQYVAFGQVTEGVKVLDFMENIPTNNGKPVWKVEVKDCGLVNLEGAVDEDISDRKVTPGLKDPEPRTRPRKTETISEHVCRLVMEALTDCLAKKEHDIDVIHVGDAPSLIRIDLYFKGYYSLSDEAMEEIAHHLRTFRREVLRYVKPSATEIAEVITYDLQEAAFIKLANLDDLREAIGHPMYSELLEKIDMELEMVRRPFVRTFVNQLAATAENMLNLISKKLNWIRSSSHKNRVFQEQMNEWVTSFVLQETFAGDEFYIVNRSPVKEEPPYDPCAVKGKKKKRFGKEPTPSEICCYGDADEDDILGITDIFSTCRYDLKKPKRDTKKRLPVIELIEFGRHCLRTIRHHENRVKTNKRICLEKNIDRWMKGVTYVSDIEWIRQTILANDDVCFSHIEEIMYGAMTVGLIEIYYLMEEYLKTPKKKVYRTKLLYPEDDSITDTGQNISERDEIELRVNDITGDGDQDKVGGGGGDGDDDESKSKDKLAGDDVKSAGDDAKLESRIASADESRKSEIHRSKSTTSSQKDVDKQVKSEPSIKSDKGDKGEKTSRETLGRCSCGDVCCDCPPGTKRGGKFRAGFADGRSKKQSGDSDTNRLHSDGGIPPTPPPSLATSHGSDDERSHRGRGGSGGRSGGGSAGGGSGAGGSGAGGDDDEDDGECESTTEESGGSSCTDTSYIDVEAIMAKITGESEESINIKSFKWMEDYILSKGCQLKSDFAGQVHNWLENEVFVHKFISKHSLVTRASLLSLSLSIASMLREDNELKSELKDFVYDLWELYFIQMFKEAELEYPTQYEQVRPGTSQAFLRIVTGDSERKKDFDYDKYCRESTAVPAEVPQSAPKPVQEAPKPEPEPAKSETEEVEQAGEIEATEAASVDATMGDSTTLPYSGIDMEVLGEDQITAQDVAQVTTATTKGKKAREPIVVRELQVSSDELRQTSPYVHPFWVKFLAEVTKMALGLISKVTRLPRRLYYTTDSQISLEDRMKAWIEFNKYHMPTTSRRDLKDFISKHHVKIEDMDASARSFLRKKIIAQVIERSTRSKSAEILANELLTELLGNVLDMIDAGEGHIPAEFLRSLMGGDALGSMNEDEEDEEAEEEEE